MPSPAESSTPGDPSSRPAKPRIVGEALVDVFPDGQRIVGGAPLNVAWNLKGLGHQPRFHSKVGDDELGRMISESMGRWGLSLDGLATTSDHQTGSVSVTLDDGKPTYEIAFPVAYDFIDPPNFSSDDGGLVYLGSLAWRSPDSQSVLRQWISAAGRNRFIDINLRSPWYRDEVIEILVTEAMFVKLNDDELGELCECPVGNRQEIEKAAEIARNRWSCQCLLVTCGSSGAYVFTGDETHFAEAAQPAKYVDTVGAGDAFASAFLDGWLRGHEPSTCLRQGVQFAARICGIAGATSDDHSLYQGELIHGDHQ